MNFTVFPSNSPEEKKSFECEHLDIAASMAQLWWPNRTLVLAEFDNLKTVYLVENGKWRFNTRDLSVMFSDKELQLQLAKAFPEYFDVVDETGTSPKFYWKPLQQILQLHRITEFEWDWILRVVVDLTLRIKEDEALSWKRAFIFDKSIKAASHSYSEIINADWRRKAIALLQSIKISK